MTFSTYQQTIDYLFEQLPMFQRIGAAAFKKDLTNIRLLCSLHGDPQLKYPTVHIAGTNGKGSTAHILAAVLQSCGLRVGLLTSPHYRDFRERIKINGDYVSEQYVIDFVNTHHSAWATIEPSFFELSVLMGFAYFADQQVDVAIIETGLGGELDSTNVVAPVLSIITNISYDHQQFLGETLPEIASAKAGIIKLETPVVIGERQREMIAVFEAKAKQQNAPIYYANDHYKAQLKSSSLFHSVYDVYRDKELLYSDLQMNSIGNYQRLNLQTCLQALELLNDNFTPISEEQLRVGLQQLTSLTNFMGRWQVLSESPLVLADSAHNEAGIQQAMEFLQVFEAKKLHIVLGFSSDKDLRKVLPLFPKTAIYYFAKPNVPRGLEVAILQEKALEHKLNGTTFSSIPKALEAAKKAAKEDDLVYVGGSIYGLAEVV